MKICILCDDAHITETREAASSLGNNNALKIGVSESGTEPATHWFCLLEVDKVGYQKIVNLNQHAIIEETSPVSFLAKRKLKIIK